MTSRSKNFNPLGGMHTAGIFSDMSVDGPEIGTLVLIVDRAKNLPNRKTIGKQDPYCAARLGKEAKKTATDIRGGQTPRWDQELRFTVHDSPDYFQLKLSVFNDDKKTELIGESWIDLRDIIVPGGGQSDQWHNLNCRGKYAGNIRIEMTYYDSRPKPEKMAAKPRPVTSSSELDTSGSAPRLVVKRRPLPSDPLPGQFRPHAPDSISTSPRPQPNPLVDPTSNQSPSPAADYSTPPFKNHPQQQLSQIPQTDHYSPTHGVYQFSSSAPHRDYQGRGVVDSFHTSQYELNSSHQPGSAIPRPQEANGRVIQNNMHPGYATHAHHRSAEDVTRPPPPPAHGVRSSNGHSPDLNGTHRGGYEMVPHKATPPMRHGVLRNEAHRYSGSLGSSPSAYPGRPTYRPYDSTPSLQKGLQYNDYDLSLSSTSQHHSYDSTNDAHHRQMQPTVEDVPESWTPPHNRSRSSLSQFDELELDSASNPASSNVNGHTDVLHERYSTGQLQLQARYDSYNHNTSPSPMSQAELSQALTHVPRSQTYQVDRYQNKVNEVEDHMYRANDYNPSSVPPTLVPGVDPSLAREVSQQIHQGVKRERRYTQPMQMVVHSRGRQPSEPPSHYTTSYSPHDEPARAYERASASYSNAPNTPPGPAERPNTHRVSPSPGANHNHTIKRKSVSPAPPPSEPRRSSGVPFGPDSYDVLNPLMAASMENSNTADYTNANGKIVTSDGREVDPSDHLPVDTWAPEPEARKPAQPAETRSRPVPGGAQPMPPSGRRPLRIAARPQSSTTLASPAQAPHEPVSPSNAGRNRLQKKAHRASALPAPITAGSSPLGPASAQQRNSTPPRALVQANMFDYENHGPPFDRESGVHGGSGSGPPIPSKVPMMSGGLGPPTSGPGGNEEMALMAEMSRIHIGTGRARRHGRY
ncbi:hypothetical protein GGS21DRAFT_212650 [Xylaria nigripes]|nr:hypothetical protein GGS21DRAFT_212650 [Xylaria nigripes]